MKSFVRNGNDVESITNGLVNPQLIVFGGPANKMSDIAKELSEKYPQSQVIGGGGICSANGQTSESQICLSAFFDDVEVAVGILKETNRCPVVNISTIKSDLEKVKPNKDNTVCFEFCSSNEETVVTVLNSVLNDIPLVGGSSMGYDSADGKQIVAYNGNVYTDSCVYAIIKNKVGKIHVFKENIYIKPEGAKPHFATKVDTSKRMLYELDGRPASEVYMEETGVDKKDIVDNVMKNPMGRAVGDAVFIASMRTLEEDGALTYYKVVNKNDCMYILELSNYIESERKMREKIKKECSKISLVMSINCIYRYLFYTSENYFETLIKDMGTLGQHWDIVGGGEQYINQHVNQSMVCVVFE